MRPETMKLSQIMHAITLALLTNNIISMEAPPVEAHKTLAPFARSASHEAIQRALKCFDQKKIDLDQLFDCILPTEIAQRTGPTHQGSSI
jgi:hypothetical protein